MRITAVLVAIVLAGSLAEAQRRSGTGPATLAIMVTDQAGSPIADVRVTLEGPASREARTERGRLVFEGLPSGSYRLTFEHEGFVASERDVTARGVAPVDVKVTLTRAPSTPAKAERPPLTPVAPIVDAEPVAIDVPSFIEKNFVGRAAGKTSLLACAPSGEATLIQLHEPLADHVHAAADEYLYVIAGEGTARAGTAATALRAGMFMMVPRGVKHSLSASGRSPLVVISVKSGEKCSPPGTKDN
jgi:mannose-6-phosphate isomerase-like protein (cupin superfamily)